MNDIETSRISTSILAEFSQLFKLIKFPIRPLILFMTFLSVSEVFAQCGFVVGSGCSGTDYSNSFMNSNTNATSIEYDNFVNTFHSTVVREANGQFKAWGEAMGNSASDLLSPQIINNANFPALGSAIIYKVAGASYGSGDNVQMIALASDGLYAWSKEGMVIDNSLTSSSTFQKITVGGKADGLPTGVSPVDIKMMTASTGNGGGTLVIVTCSGNVWVLSKKASHRGNGSTGNSTTWYQVETTGTGVYLTNVVVARVAGPGAIFALKSDGTIWTWGEDTYLGNGTAPANRTRATQMTLPSGISGVKMLGVTFSDNSSLPSYYLLATNGNLYALGSNSRKQLGDWTTSDRTSWVQPRYTSSTGQVMNNIRWISPNETDPNYGSINAIRNDSILYAWGENSKSMIGRGNGVSTADPEIPDSLNTNKVIAVKTGGHTSMIVINGTCFFGYVGHRINGSMADGTSTDQQEDVYGYNTSQVNLCGSPSVSISPPIGIFCVGITNTIQLTATPSGGNWTVSSGPGTINASGLVTVTGAGTIVVKYSGSGGCNTTSDTVHIKINAKPNAGTDQTACQSGSATMSASGLGTWTAQSGNPGTASIANINSPTTTITGFSSSGIYNFIWSNGSCSDTAKVVVTSKPNAGADQNGICGGSGVTLTGSSPATGSWTAVGSNPTGGNLSATVGGISTVSFTNSSNGSYSFVYTANGCTDTMIATVISKPNPPVASFDTVVCLNGSKLLSVSGSSGANFTWIRPNSTTSSGNSINVNLATIADSGKYIVRQTVMGCISDPDSVLLTVITPPVIASGAVSQPTACNTNNGSFSITGLKPFTTYLISYTGTSSVTNAGFTSNASGTITVGGLAIGSYTNVTARTNIAACPSNSIGVIAISGPVPVGIPIVQWTTKSGLNDTVCSLMGAKKYFVSSGTSDVTNYSWTVNNGAVITTTSGVKNDTVNINFALATGVVTVSVTPSNVCGNGNGGSFLVYLNPDCDGDGVPNTVEISSGTNPLAPCKYVSSQVTLPKSIGWSSLDCDGDGISNGREIKDNTDPLDTCNFLSTSHTSATLLAMLSVVKMKDCDGDGVTNIKELDQDGNGTLGPNLTDPKDPCSFNIAQITVAATSSVDCDGDGVTNKDEINGPDGNPSTPDGTNPKDPCSYNMAQITVAATSDVDCDGDGVTNKDEINGPDGNPSTPDGTNPKDPCSFNIAQITVAATSAADCDGDGVTNKDEINGPDGNPSTLDGTNPKDPCSYNITQITVAATSAADCDGDGVTNKDEINGPDGNPSTPDGTNPKDPCSFNIAQITVAATSAVDCDGDGVTNKDEINGPDGNPSTLDGTNPKDPCSYHSSQITLLVTVYGCNRTYPDVNITNVNQKVVGNVNTNDIVLPGTNYGMAVALGSNPSNTLPIINSDGSYTFLTQVSGVYKFFIPVCSSGQTNNCPIEMLIITVLDRTKSTNPSVANVDLAITKGIKPVMIKTLVNDRSGNIGTLLNPSSVAVVLNPKHGNVLVNPSTGNVLYKADSGFMGLDTVHYRVCDDATPSNCAISFQVIRVLSPNSLNETLATDDYIAGKGVLSGNALTNDIDPENDNRVIESQNVMVPDKGNFILNEDGTYKFIPAFGFMGPIEFVYTVCDNGSPMSCSNATIKILSEYDNDGCQVPNYLSPNGDGINDVFNLDCVLLEYPNAKLIVYNRWGNVVWRSSEKYGKSNSNDNIWYGQLEGSQDIVPDGVYYYLIELDANFSLTKTGFIEIMRQ